MSATALTSLVLLASPAQAVVINDNFTPAQVVDTTNVTGVGQMVVDEQNGFIGLCTVTLINPRTVIFASHCVNENPAETAFEPATGYGSANGGFPIGFFFNANNNQAGNSAIGHWLNGVAGGPKDLTRVADNAYNSNFVVYNTNCCTIGLGNNFLQSDVAMAALDTPAVGIPTWTTLFSPLTQPVHSTIEGYGDNGIGTTGQGTIDFKRRVAENVVSVLGSLDDQDTFLFGAPDGLPANLYMIDFNDPKFNTAQANAFDFNIFHDSALTREGVTAPGDSGGPLIIDHAFTDVNGNPVSTVAGVLSGGDRFFNAQPGASYGTTSFYQPLYLYWDWIVSNNPYKYVGNVAGNGSWTDPAHWQMNLDPAYMTIDANGHLVNGLPTTPAAGETNQPPGFGEVCYFDDCIDLKTGVQTNPTPAPGPNPTNATGPFGGLLGQAGFDALVQQYIAAQNGQSSSGVVSGGPAIVDDSVFNSDGSSGSSGGAMGGGTGSILNSQSSAQSDWTNPEGSATVGGELVQGAPGSALGGVPDDTNGDVGTNAPPRYYDVTLAADGITTLSGATITVDRLTVNGANTQLTIASDGHLTSLIDTTIDAGDMQVDGTYVSAGAITVNGGVLSGAGTITAPSISSVMGIITPGSIGTIATLTLDSNLTLSSLSTYLADITPNSNDLLMINGTAAIDGFFGGNFATGSYTLGTQYTVLTSTGALTGTFTDGLFLNTPAGILTNLSYDAHDVFLTLTEAPFVWGMSGTGDWNTASSWQYNLPASAGDVAIFDAGTQTSVTIGQPTAAKSLQFNAGAPAYSFAITGSASGPAALTLSNGIADASSNPPSFMVSGTSATNFGLLAFTGAGTAADAMITAGNFGGVSFAGTTDAGSATTLVAQSGGVFDFTGTTGTANDHNINAGSIAGAGVFNIGGNTLTTGALNTSTEVSGMITGAGGLTKIGTGTLILSGANDYAGTTTVSSGTLQIGNGGTSGSIAGDVVDNATLAFNRSDNSAFDGNISGSGNLVQAGSGGTALAGTNTYGGTTTISSGLLQIGNGGTTGTLGAGAVLDSGTLAFDRTDSFAVANAISGTGGVSQFGTGTVTLSSPASYSGATLVAAGTLAAGASGAFSNTSAFEVEGALDLNGFDQTISSVSGAGMILLTNASLTTNGDNSSSEFSGMISGAGGLIKTGTGTLILSGGSDYSGGTTISSGTLQIGNGAASGMITGDVENNGALVFDRADDGAFAGVISGSGTFTQAGIGNLFLTGANLYTGATTVSHGTLTVDGSVGASAVTVKSGALLAGTGTVGSLTAASGSSLAPGSNGSIGTLTVDGDATLSDDTTFLVGVSKTSASKLAVTGTLAVTGNLVVSNLVGYAPHYGDTGVIATAASITGDFSSVMDELPGVLKATVTVISDENEDEALLKITADSFLTQFTPTSKDQLLIATTLDNARAAHYTELSALYDLLDTETDGTLSQSLENLTPDAERALGLVGQLALANFDGMVTDHLGDIGQGPQSDPQTSGFHGDGLTQTTQSGFHPSSFHIDGTGLQTVLSSMSSYSAKEQPFVQIGQRLADGSGFSSLVASLGDASGASASGGTGGAAAGGDTWLALPGGAGGFLTGRSLNGDVAVGGGGGNARVEGYLIAGGLDFPIDDHFTVGATFGGGHANTKLHQVASSKTSFVQGGVYGRYDGDDNIFVTGFASVGGESIKTHRTVVLGASTFSLSGKTNGTTPSLGFTAGKSFIAHSDGVPFTLTPFVGFQYEHIGIDSFTEHGGAPALAFQDYGNGVPTGRVGADVKTAFGLGDLTVMPTVHLALVEGFGSTNGAVQAAFAGVPSTLMSFDNAPRTDTYGEFGLGSDFDLGQWLGRASILTVHYNTDFGRSDMKFHGWTAALKVAF